MKNPLNLMLLAVVVLFSSFEFAKEVPTSATVNFEPTFHNHVIVNENSPILQPAITITKPTAGQEYCLHQPRYIQWQTSGAIIEKVSIYLMHPNGVSIISPIATDIENNGSYLWTSTSSNEGDFAIRVSGESNLSTDLVIGRTGAFTLNDCQKPDLQVGQVTIEPQSPGEGQRVKYSANVMNYGENPVVNPVVMLEVKRPDGLPDLRFTQEIEHTLTKNQGIPFEKRFRVPVAGNYTATLTLDPARRVDEMNEMNNKKDWTFGVHKLPDLIVCIDNGKRPPVGRSREIRMVVKNIGNYPTNAISGIKLRTYVEAKGVKIYDIPPLGPNDTYTIKRNHKWGLAGTKTITAQIIYEKAEIKANNNNAQSSYFVRLPHHDTYSTAPKVKCSTGETFYNWQDFEN